MHYPSLLCPEKNRDIDDDPELCYKGIMLVDSHCHLELEDFDLDRDEVIEESKKEGLKYILTVGTEKMYFGRVLEIIEKYDFVYGAIGVHPHSSRDWKSDFGKELEKFLKHKKIVALGEIGLDFYKNYSPPDVQKEVFAIELALARKNEIPVIIHSRNAESETIEILDSFYPDGRRGVIHCFSYDRDAAKKFLDRGFYISIPGTITFTNVGRLVEAVKYIPLEMILVETDAPFLTPQRERGKRNVPYYVRYTLDRVAQIKRISPSDLGEIVVRNFENLFLKGA